MLRSFNARNDSKKEEDGLLALKPGRFFDDVAALCVEKLAMNFFVRLSLPPDLDITDTLLRFDFMCIESVPTPLLNFCALSKFRLLCVGGFIFCLLNSEYKFKLFKT